MPTYEYRCQECGHTIEAVQSFSDDPLTVCDVCGGRLRRVFHPVGIVLKGSGFYSTDNRTTKRPAAKPNQSKEATAADSGPSEAGAPAKADKKPAPEKKASPEKKPSGGSGAQAS